MCGVWVAKKCADTVLAELKCNRGHRQIFDACQSKLFTYFVLGAKINERQRMNLMPWLIVGLVVCMALGPVMLMQPSKRQGQLARLRSRAAQLNVSVRLSEWEGDSVATYSVPWPADNRRRFDGPKGVAMRKSYQHPSHLLDYWELPKCFKTGPVNTWISDLVSKQPQSVVGIQVNEAGVGVYWLERGTQTDLDTIVEVLKAAAQSGWLLLSSEKSPAS